MLQCVWVYNRAIDIDGLRRFHHHLQQGRLSRRIERSPLPFGRHRWVSPSGQSDLEIVATPRPREEFDAWLSEQANTPLDAEHGPEWHLAVLPFTDGGAGVSLVISHCLTDAVGLCEALADAACGHHDAIRLACRRLTPAVASAPRGRPPNRARHPRYRRSRRRRSTIGPTQPRPRGINRAAKHQATCAARRSATNASRSQRQRSFVDADEWDARAHSLGGTSNTLLAGLAARLAQRVGRVTADGSVTLGMPVNLRTAGDTRANAVTNVDITVDPAPATTDLREMRAATKQALIRSQEQPDERLALLPLVPLLPQWLVKRMVSLATASATSVVSSNFGVVNPAVYRPDGTDADHFAMKGSNSGVTKAIMHRTGGIMALLSGRSDRQVFVSVLAYQPGRANSNDDSAKRPFERSERLLAHRHDRLAMP